MRWVGPFATANIAAMEMACIGCLLVLGTLWCLHRSTDKAPLFYLSIGCGIGAVITFLLLISTGSRAGTLAALLCLSMLSVLRHVPWRLTLLIQGLLIIGTLLAPFQSRYTGISSDSSALFRITLATSALSMIRDHPLGLGDEAQDVFLNWYMPPAEEGYALSTTLNEATTCAIRHGIPVLAVAVALLSVVLCIGVQYSWRSRLLPTAGLIILSVHIIGGQFQAYLFGSSTIIIYMWVLGCILCLWGNPHSLHKHSLWICAIVTLICSAALMPLGNIIGESKWSTQIFDGHLFAKPDSQEIDGIIVIVNNEEISAAALNRFRETCHAHNQALLWCQTVPNRNLVHTLTRQGHINCSITASALDASRLWAAWRNGETGTVRVIICDPAHIPAEGNKSDTGELILVMAKFGLLPERERMINAAAADGAGDPVLLRTLSASWWAQPQTLLELHQNNQVQ